MFELKCMYIGTCNVVVVEKKERKKDRIKNSNHLLYAIIYLDSAYQTLHSPSVERKKERKKERKEERKKFSTRIIHRYTIIHNESLP